MEQAFRRNWDGRSWQLHAFMLVQLRHGASNVQRVPDKVRGDAGLEFFTYDGCLYQCYAPETPGDTAKSSSAMKQKATRDLPKLKKNEAVLTRLLNGLSFKRWILLCPFLDDKAVVTHVRSKGTSICGHNLSFLTADFEALVQCQEDFFAEAEKLRELPIGPELQISIPTEEAVSSMDATPLVNRLDEKLGRAYSSIGQEKRISIRKSYVKSHIKRENTLSSLKAEHPHLWERAWQTINAEENRLELLGAAGQSAPAEHLSASLDRIASGLAKDLPRVSHATISDLSTGTLCDWLMRCPLDFDGEQ
ncbi:hypothetical protein [Rhizobium leguminosarum]|uniref:hypothetical protein n=1 Tax=Rhizobium leguminosarum TaxID=384 RepID=UPI00103EB1DE|nr:hypothetical protein [Rhizobium leguminosarum]TCA02555.1 hypothetical protein E0H57_20615 [Rhizobium leguminosarum bv. viciae]